MTAHLTPERLAEVRARVEGLALKPDSTCPIEATDSDGSLGPCGLPVRTWAWYDGYDHEPMLIACCHGHETEGAESLAQVVATDVPDLLAEVERLTERAERAEGALARVEALVDRLDEIADQWPYSHWHVSQKANVRNLREAMEGKPSTPENITPTKEQP